MALDAMLSEVFDALRATLEWPWWERSCPKRTATATQPRAPKPVEGGSRTKHTWLFHASGCNNDGQIPHLFDSDKICSRIGLDRKHIIIVDAVERAEQNCATV